jgi:Xaa-Pro dipeptidase
MAANMKSIEASLVYAQDRAEELFAAIIANGLIQPGKLESELSDDIHALARSQFGVSRHWHKRIARAGRNTMLGYHDAPADRRIAEDDVVYLDLGPVFSEWEADFGRTYVLGSDPIKHQLVGDLAQGFAQGKEFFRKHPHVTAGELYDYVVNWAQAAGWEFGAISAGHLIGEFPHEHAPGDSKRFSIRHGNDLSLREPDAKGAPRHWILEIHLIDRNREFGGFYEQLLTI